MKCLCTRLLYSGEHKKRLAYKATISLKKKKKISRKWTNCVPERNGTLMYKSATSKKRKDLCTLYRSLTPVNGSSTSCGNWNTAVQNKNKSGENKHQWMNLLQRKADLQHRNQLQPGKMWRQLKIVPSLEKMELLPGLYRIYGEVNILEPLNFRTASFCQTLKLEKGAAHSMQWNIFSWRTI